MKRSFFLVCCIITCSYVGNGIVAEQQVSGVMNAPLHMQHYDIGNYLHGGIDVYWTFATSPWPSPSGSASNSVPRPPLPALSERPYLLAYSDGAMLLNPADFLSAVNCNPLNVGANLCINPRATTTVMGTETVYYVLEDPKYWFGAGHCDWGFRSEIELVQVGGNPVLIAKAGSKLAGLQADIRDAYLHGFASVAHVTCSNPLPSGAYVTYDSKILVPGINAADKIAVMGDWWGGTSPQDYLHFHMLLKCQNGGYGFENIGEGPRLNDYPRSLLATAQTPSISIGDFLLRENWRDWVCNSTPAGSPGETVFGKYVKLTDATATPSVGFLSMNPRAVVFRDVDFLEDASNVEGYKFADFDRIEFKINRIDRVRVTPSGMAETCRPTLTNVVFATPYLAPNVEMTDDSFGVTYPPWPQVSANVVAPFGRNGDYGYIFELQKEDAGYTGKEQSWQNNPYTEEGGDTARYRAFWILTNLHTKYSQGGTFRLDPRDRYNCWNSNVHRDYRPAGAGSEVGWWLPPQTDTRTYPPLYHSSGAPSYAPPLTNNQAYHPDYAFFPEGRYNIETKYVPNRGEARTRETSDFSSTTSNPISSMSPFSNSNWTGTTHRWRGGILMCLLTGCRSRIQAPQCSLRMLERRRSTATSILPIWPTGESKRRMAPNGVRARSQHLAGTLHVWWHGSTGQSLPELDGKWFTPLGAQLYRQKVGSRSEAALHRA